MNKLLANDLIQSRLNDITDHFHEANCHLHTASSYCAQKQDQDTNKESYEINVIEKQLAYKKAVSKLNARQQTFKDEINDAIAHLQAVLRLQRMDVNVV